MSTLKTLAQLTTFDDYKKDLLASLKLVKITPVPLHYIQRVPFSTRAGPAVIVGKLEPSLKEELTQAKLKPKAGRIVRALGGTLVVDEVAGLLVADALKFAAVTDRLDPAATFEDTPNAKASNVLDKHLVESGRSSGDQVKREKMAGRILQSMEKGTNERNDELALGRAPSHHVSAHGPDTDQVSRLVTGRRSDELEHSGGGKIPTVTLTGNTLGLGDTDVPIYAEVGNNPNTRSGKFSSNVAMLQTLEEAFAQMSLLDGYLTGLLKQAAAKRYQKILALPEVKIALGKAADARKRAHQAKLKLRTPNLNSRQIAVLVEHAQDLDQGAREAGQALAALIEKFEKEIPVEKPPELQVGEERVARSIKPGRDTKAGIGRGLVLNESPTVGKQTSGPVAVGGKSTEETMQERFRAIQPTGAQNTATVVLDPAYVRGKDGKKVRAGWDVQTAFPTDNPGHVGLETEGASKEFVDLAHELGTLEKAAVRLKNAIKKQGNDFKLVNDRLLDQEAKIKSKSGKALQGLKAAVQKKKLAGQDASAQEDKVVQMEEEIAKLKLELPGLEEAVAKATVLRDEEVAQLEKKLEAAQKKIAAIKKKLEPGS